MRNTLTRTTAARAVTAKLGTFSEPRERTAPKVGASPLVGAVLDVPEP